MLEPLDKECRKFLKTLRKLAEKTQRSHVLVEDIGEKGGFSEDTMCSIIEFLCELRILKCDNCGGDYCTVYLTQRGRHYTAYRWYEFKKTIVFSILLPLIISAISGALTALLI